MTISLRLAASDTARLRSHLFRPDRDEHAAIILAGTSEHGHDLTLLGRELHCLGPAEFTAGEYGYRQISPATLARLGNRAAEQGLALVSCHSHPGARNSVALSRDDLDGHQRVFPHLLDIVDGSPVAGIAFGYCSAAGEVWRQDSRPRALDGVRVIGADLDELRSSPDGAGQTRERFDRQARMFGAAGQEILRSAPCRSGRPWRWRIDARRAACSSRDWWDHRHRL